MPEKRMRISIVVYDDNKRKLFKRDTIELRSGLNQLSDFLETKLGIKSHAFKINPKVSHKCAVCKRVIGQGEGMSYKDKQVHKTCIAEAIQWL